MPVRSLPVGAVSGPAPGGPPGEGPERQFLPFLLITLLPVLVFPWASSGAGSWGLLMPLLFAVLAVQSLRTFGRLQRDPGPRWFLLAFRLLALLATVALLVPVLDPAAVNLPPLVRSAAVVLAALFLLLSAVQLLRVLGQVARVNPSVLAGAAAGYMHLGLTGGVAGAAIELVHPGAFALGPISGGLVSDALVSGGSIGSIGGGPIELLDRLIYFSFVTIAGLGYGDVIPADVVGERYAILLSVAGTLYVSLLVGVLLGRFIAAEEAALLQRLETAEPPAPAPEMDASRLTAEADGRRPAADGRRPANQSGPADRLRDDGAPAGASADAAVAADGSAGDDGRWEVADGETGDRAGADRPQ